MKATAVSMIVTFLLFCSPARSAQPNPSVVSTVDIELVTIGNPGNANDQGGFGAVNYAYSIGKFEVTNSQYVNFLNSVAATDNFALFDAQMQSSQHGGIIRSGTIGSFHYDTKSGATHKPVNFVSWYDAARFANWLHNGKGSADTETGAYTLQGGTPVPSNEARIRRNTGARWFIPSESEWHKAAYFNPSSNSYFDYPTGSDLPPVVEASAGGARSANLQDVVGTVIEVGAYPLAESPYGTFDQAGNLWEWNESVYFASDRGHRGGSWGYLDSPQVTLANLEWALGASIEREITGFRIATIVPEPNAAVLAALAFAGAVAASSRNTLANRRFARTASPR